MTEAVVNLYRKFLGQTFDLETVGALAEAMIPLTDNEKINFLVLFITGNFQQKEGLNVDEKLQAELGKIAAALALVQGGKPLPTKEIIPVNVS